jgi:hypothetical protein
MIVRGADAETSNSACNYPETCLHEALWSIPHEYFADPDGKITDIYRGSNRTMEVQGDVVWSTMAADEGCCSSAREDR